VRRTGGVGVRVEERLDRRQRRLIGLADQDGVDERGGGERVREGEGAAQEDPWVPRAAVATQGRDAGELEELDQPGELELVGQRDGDERKAPERGLRLVRDGARSTPPVLRRIIR